MIRCVLMGGGGHARVVIDALRTMPEVELVGIIDPKQTPSELDGVPFLGGDEKLQSLASEGVTHFVLGMGSIGKTVVRRRVSVQMMEFGFLPLTVVHARAIVSPAAQLGLGVQVIAGATINPGAILHEFAIANTGCIIEHDAEVGAYAHIAPGAVVAGAVKVGQDAHVGAGSSIRQGIILGRNAIIGLGAAVLNDVPDDEVVVGVPARPLKRAST